MRPLAREEIAPLEAYAAVRDSYRERVIEHKRARRMPVGPNVTLLFEDRETLRFQVQEMLRVEQIADPARVQHELDVYNELMPGAQELSATLFIEITEPGRIRAELDRLVGLDEHVALVLGDEDDELVVPASFDAKQFEDDRIAAVQYIRFALTRAACERLADPAVPAAIRIAHPAYAHRGELRPELRASLVAGLAAEPASLLPPLPRASAGAPQVLFESERVRAVRPAPPRLPGELWVEARGVGATDDAALWAELAEALRRAARQLIAEHGGCRVVADLAPDAPLRWRLLPGAEKG